MEPTHVIPIAHIDIDCSPAEAGNKGKDDDDTSFINDDNDKLFMRQSRDNKNTQKDAEREK